MKGSLLLYNLKLNCLLFSTGLNSSLIIFIRTYTVNYRNALDRLSVRMNIILFTYISGKVPKMPYFDKDKDFINSYDLKDLLHLISGIKRILSYTFWLYSKIAPWMYILHATR